MPKYRKRPVIVEAVQWFEGDHYDGLVDRATLSEVWATKTSSDGRYFIPTLEGDMLVQNGDYIVTGTRGEKYPVKPIVFQDVYERVED